MRLILAVLVLALPLGSAAAQERPDEVVKAAIAAAGGADALSKYPAGRVAGKGTATFAGAEAEFTCEQTYHVPGRFRTVVRFEVKRQKWELVQVVDGASAKQTINARAVPLTEASMRELQLAVILNEVAQLTPLITDKRFTLKHDKQVKGPELTGLHVLVKGYPDLRLAFDRKTGHLVRVAYKDTDPETAKEAETEIVFSEFQTASGLTRPSRTVFSRDGKKVLDLAIEKFTPLGKVDPKVFTLE
jgi:hypothetical protein